MAEIVNLNRARKRKNKRDHDAEAAANRVRHGRTAAQSAADAAVERRRDAILDGARLDDAPTVAAPAGEDH